MSLTRAWSNSTPQGTVYANQLDTFLQYLRVDLNDRMELEHRWDSSIDTASALCDGRHIPGNVSAVYVGTWAQIQALTGMMSGAMAFGTDTTTLYIYNGINWTTCIVNSLGGPVISLAALTAVPLTGCAIADWANAIDGDDDTYATITITGNTSEYYGTGFTLDLGAKYKGYFRILADMKLTSGTGSTSFRASPFVGYQSTSWMTNSSTNTASRDALVTANSSTYVTYGSWHVPFYGQYVGIMFNHNGVMRLRNFAVTGALV